MSEPKPPVMPDDDRELEDFLARRSELSRLYRQDAAEIKAPEKLDTAVLAAAQSPAPIPKAKPARLRRWRLPLSLAASMVIAFGVLREVRQLPASPPESADASTIAATSIELQAVESIQREDAASEGVTANRHMNSGARPKEPAAAKKKAGIAEKPKSDSAPRPVENAAGSGISKSNALPRAAPGTVDSPELEALPGIGSSNPLELARAKKSVGSHESSAAAALMAVPGISSMSAGESWQPAHYRGLQLGAMTVAEWQRRIGDQAVTSAPSGDARLAADATKSEAELQLEYGPGVDPRGSLRAELDLQRQRVDTVILHLTPALPLRDVEQAEALPGAARQQSESALPSDQTACRKARASGPDQGRVATRVYPERGIELRLGEDGRVTEIRYLATRPELGC